MAERKTITHWLAEYGLDHQHPVNKAIHWLCVPAICWCVLAFITAIPMPAALAASAPWFDWTLVAIIVATGFYVRLSPALGTGLLVFMALCYVLAQFVARTSATPLWKIACIVFIAAWALQFVGHILERRRPSFVQDFVFLFIGPVWLMGALYRKLGWRY